MFGSFGFATTHFLISSPSFSQLTMYSWLPYHLRNSPPLFNGNHLELDPSVSSLSSIPKPIFVKDVSCQRRRKRLLSPVDKPALASATLPNGSHSWKIWRMRGETQ